MHILARHERDDRDIELDTLQIAEFKAETGVPVHAMLAGGVRSFTMLDGWTYQLFETKDGSAT